MKTRKYTSYLKTYLIVFALVIVAILILQNLDITYQPTPSMQKGFYISRFYDTKIKKGDIVRFINPRPDLKETYYLLKKVKKVNEEKNTIFVEGKTHEELVKETGREDAYSYDSNIFGEVDIITSQAKPMILLISL